MSTVTVACKLPNGLALDLPGHPNKPVLKGAHHRDAVGGYGLTEVDAEFWAAWSARYKDFEPVKRGIIFAQPNERSAGAKAKEQKDLRSGLEGLDAEKPGPGVQAENYEGRRKRG